jgi:UDP-N-acetyl-D-mannosaminuronic acid dehydrogenase
MPFNTISVVGLGYIGLPTAAMFASKGKNVIGVDVNQKTVDTINAGNIHIVEPDLDVIVRDAVSQGYLRAVTTPEAADAFLIAVPTPFFNLDMASGIPQPDLSFVESAAKAVAVVLKKGDLVILESTSPVGATEKMAAWLAECRPDLTFPQNAGDESDIRIAHCPERVLPGQVVRELVENDRVIGGITQKCSEAAIQLYETFVEGSCVITNARTAEMAKLTENASRDVSIAFANELSIICDKLNIDVWELIDLANRHPRVNILRPGPGVGGHCIAVDPWFIVSNSPDESVLIHAARNVNDSKPHWVVNKVETAVYRLRDSLLGVSKRKITVAFYGLAFKADIDDLRESPAVGIVKSVSSLADIDILVVEPNIEMLPDDLAFCDLVSTERANELADIHVLLVNHQAFYQTKPARGLIIDTQGIWNGA